MSDVGLVKICEDLMSDPAARLFDEVRRRRGPRDPTASGLEREGIMRTAPWSLQNSLESENARAN